MEEKIQTIKDYYLPQKYMLIEVQAILLKNNFYNQEGFNIFNYYDQTQLHHYNLKEAVVSCYQDYLSKCKNLVPSYADPSIDERLGKIYTHMLFVVLNISPTLDENRYQLPEIDILIQDIDQYARKNNIFRN